MGEWIGLNILKKITQIAQLTGYASWYTALKVVYSTEFDNFQNLFFWKNSSSFQKLGEKLLANTLTN